MIMLVKIRKKRNTKFSLTVCLFYFLEYMSVPIIQTNSTHNTNSAEKKKSLLKAKLFYNSYPNTHLEDFGKHPDNIPYMSESLILSHTYYFKLSARQGQTRAWVLELNNVNLFSKA